MFTLHCMSSGFWFWQVCLWQLFIHVTEVTCSSTQVIDYSGQEMTRACRWYITSMCVAGACIFMWWERRTDTPYAVEPQVPNHRTLSRTRVVNAVTRHGVIDHLYLAKSYCHISLNLIITSNQDATWVNVWTIGFLACSACCYNLLIA